MLTTEVIYGVAKMGHAIVADYFSFEIVQFRKYLLGNLKRDEKNDILFFTQHTNTKF